MTRRVGVSTGSSRRVRLSEEVPSDRFVLIVGLMVLFFVGLVGLEVVHMIWMGAWNDIYKVLLTLSAGGEFPWYTEKGAAVGCCTDSLKPVVFKMERL